MATLKGLMITDKSNKSTGWISEVDANNVLISWEDERQDQLTNEELEALLESDGYSIETKEIEEEMTEFDGGQKVPGGETAENTAKTPSQQTIKTHSSADATGSEADGNPKTRLDWITSIVGNLAQMDMDTLSRYDVRTVNSMIGGEGDKAGVGGNSKGNMNSIAMKPSAASASMGESVIIKLQKEEQDAVFGEMDLTEEAKVKVTTLFEAAVSLRVAAEAVKIQEASTKGAEVAIEEFSEKMVQGIETYSEFCVKEFMEKNKLELISELRSELTLEFIDGLKTLFLEHNIEIPEDKVDVLEAITSENEALKRKINDLTEASMTKEKDLSEMKKKDVITQMSEGLTLMQKTKLNEAAKTILFDSEEGFKTKLDHIKKGFLTEKASPESNIDSVKKELSLVEGSQTVLVEETTEKVLTETVDPRRAAMERYS